MSTAHVDDAGEWIVRQTARIVTGPVVLFRRAGTSWTVIAAHPSPIEPRSLPEDSQLALAADASAAGEAVTIPGVDGRLLWSPVALGEGPAGSYLMLLPGSWSSTPVAEWQRSLARAFTAALQVTSSREAADESRRRARCAYDLARRLARSSSPQHVRQRIVNSVASLVGASQASLALYDEADDELVIVASHGYPVVAVEHLRLKPGSGIIGRVFQNRRPLLSRVDTSRARPRRPRYRTSSFMVVPVLAQRRVLGVLSVADRTDGRPFTTGDLALVRSLLAPAALALSWAGSEHQALEMRRAALIDPLTGLFNRRHLQARLDEEIERTRRFGQGLALLTVDIDDFKRINDTAGHLHGDEVLRGIATALRRSVRSFDLCARYGGDEFAVLLSGSHVDDAVLAARRIAQRLRRVLAQNRAVGGDFVTVSIGVATLGPATTAQQLLARTDEALYEAKAAGKDCIRVADEA